jgi:integrase
VIRLYVKPGLGKRPLTRLSVLTVQEFLNSHLEAGASVPKVQAMQKVLSSVLTQAMREELVTRNVARLVTLSTWTRKDVGAWSADEARRFLHAAQGNRLYAAFLLLLVYGFRRGEVLGLRWADIDFDVGVIRIRQQVQRIGRQLLIGPTKTSASRRDLPMVDIVRAPLTELQQEVSALLSSHGGTQDNDLVFTTSTGRPIEPSNFVRSFERLSAAAGIRRIRVTIFDEQPLLSSISLASRLATLS